MSAMLQFLNRVGAADLVQNSSGRVVEGDDLVNQMFASLYTDAPPDVGDPVPDGVEVNRHWAIAFDDSTIRGSKLWMLRYVRPAPRAQELARLWTADALAWMVTAGRLLSVDVSAKLSGSEGNRRIDISVVVTLPDETRRSFVLPTIPYAV